MMKPIKKLVSFVLILTLFLCAAFAFPGCGGEKKEKVVIYTSAEDYRVEDLRARLNEQFPDYEIVIEYMTTGNHAAKLFAEGINTECDITHDLEYPYLAKLEKSGSLAELSQYDFSVYASDAAVSKYYIPEYRNGGAIIVDKQALDEKNLPMPASYEDLLKPEYKGLVIMPNPKSSGTGYIFLQSLTMIMGEEAALEYFDKLNENIIEYTSSGSGPVNKLIQKEAAIGLGMTGQAVTANNNGADFEILFFEEGSPYNMYGQGIISGKETREAVKNVFDFMINTYNREANNKFFPEQIFADGPGTVENYPQNIKYADMGDTSPESKDALLAKWKY